MGWWVWFFSLSLMVAWQLFELPSLHLPYRRERWYFHTYACASLIAQKWILWPYLAEKDSRKWILQVPSLKSWGRTYRRVWVGCSYGLICILCHVAYIFLLNQATLHIMLKVCIWSKESSRIRINNNSIFEQFNVYKMQ